MNGKGNGTTWLARSVEIARRARRAAMVAIYPAFAFCSWMYETNESESPHNPIVDDIKTNEAVDIYF